MNNQTTEGFKSMGDTSPPEEAFLFTFFLIGQNHAGVFKTRTTPRQRVMAGVQDLSKNKVPGNKDPGEDKGINEGDSNCRKEVLR